MAEAAISETSSSKPPKVQIIVPARNEEVSLGRCLESLSKQDRIDFQITVVDDNSSDRTRAIAESFPKVRVISATEPPPGVTGKCNALIQGADGATAEWLLFTDADTVHCPGSLASLVNKAEVFGADLFSVSPEQETSSWSEKLIQPLIFADLAFKYPPRRVNDPEDPTVAANGQFLLVRRAVYESLGGHKAVANRILDDVELARIFKESGHVIWFENSSEVRARMYRTFRSLVEGWTKNLALLYRHPLRLAAFEMFSFLLVLTTVTTGLLSGRDRGLPGLQNLFSTGILYYVYVFVIRMWLAKFPIRTCFIAFFGLPLYSWLLLRSWLRYRKGGNVTWKGRTYPISVTGASPKSSIKKGSEAKGPHLHGLLDSKG